MKNYFPIFKNLSYVAVFRIGTRSLTLIKTLLLARMISPYQFGLFGIATLVLSLLEVLSETGINVFLIQRKGEINEYINSAWVISIIRGTMLFLLIVLSAPFIADFFNSSEAFPLITLMSTVPLIRGFINPAIVSFQKNLQFNYEVLLRSSLFIIDTVIGILITYLLQDPIGLVWGFIISGICEVAYSWIFIKPTPRLYFELDKIRIIFSKGKWVTAFGIFNYLAKEGDTIVVGRMLNAAFLGIYQMGYKVSTLPISEFGDVISQVAFPTFAQVRDDKRKLLDIFTKATLLILVPTFFISILLFLFPQQIVGLLLGEKWKPVAEILPILAVYGALRAPFGFAATLFLAIERQDLAAWMTFIRFLGLAVTIIPLTSLYGLYGTALSALLSVIVEIPFVLYSLYSVSRVDSKQ